MSAFGDPSAVLAAADSLRGASTRTESARSLVQGAQPEIWQGAAADAFTASARRSLPRATDLAETLVAASGTLTRYAAAQRAARANFESAQADTDRAISALRSNPLDIPAALHLAKSQLGAFGAHGQLQQAASIAAAELQASLGEDGAGRSWWDPFGWFNDEANPDRRVTKDIMDDDSFDPDDVSQGGMGDCYLLVSIVSLLNTDAGDKFVRDHIRWDDDKNGYWVTLYPGGKPKEIFVDYVYGQGATQHDWVLDYTHGDKRFVAGDTDKPSIAALYESAYQQEYDYDKLSGGGKVYEAMELITGKPSDVIGGQNSGGMSGWTTGLDEQDFQSLRQVINDGGQVALSTPDDGEYPLTVTDSSGNTREIEIVTDHAYAATRIDPDGGVWVRNPWGPGNSADGGGEFRVSPEDAAKVFKRSASGNITH